MAWSPPPRAPWVAQLNALGESAGDGGRALVPLDVDGALAAAERETGLSDFGDDGFREGFGIFSQALEEEAQLTLVGRLMARAENARILRSRLRIEALFTEHPEIARERVVAPLFVTGLARTGTSLLHELLWRDPSHRAPLAWEMMYPADAALAPGVDPAPAIARAAQEIELQNHALPATRTMHELGAELPNECIYLFAHEFATDMFTGFYQIPRYTMWMATRDHTPLYAQHRRLLQLLQWRRPQRWVTKAPSHMNHLRELFAAYPDARVVITHRDPLQVLGSLANLMASLRWTRSDHVDYDALVGAMAFGHAFLAERVMKERDAGTLPADQILDVRYCDLIADPVGTVRRIAKWRGAPLGADAEAALGRWIARRPKDRHGAHDYSFADTGLDLATERARHAEYQRRYDVPSEV
jgi:Sulfotransferase family